MVLYLSKKINLKFIDVLKSIPMFGSVISSEINDNAEQSAKGEWFSHHLAIVYSGLSKHASSQGSQLPVSF